jgi:hypothetical protein
MRNTTFSCSGRGIYQLRIRLVFMVAAVRRKIKIPLVQPQQSREWNHKFTGPSFFNLKIIDHGNAISTAYKFTSVRMLNYLKPGNGWTVDSVMTQEDLTLTDNIEVMRWFNMRVWGHPGPAPNHAYVPLARLNSILS